MQQPVSFCTACLIAPTRFAKPPVFEKHGNPCAVELCGYPNVMTYESDCEERNYDMQMVFTLDLAGDFKSVDAGAEGIFGDTAENMCRMKMDELGAPPHDD